ncbi:hypothetical protein [Faecalibacter rhinopitheci]|uniref:DUF3108 domain-containing protein n=1 Tax=Faecalibacter rhinopitheci TaxID=2779678 RepID=A0A8J7FTR7_9FLAO|nr:hypothetical protein [Faecalibacter rhinopitheci]MBF0596261.1 hypothetical protein [Faecalibacter rhinopitheci]
MRKLAFLLLFLQCFIIFAQKTINTESLMVFTPTEDSKKINQAYAENMFFGIFGVKHFINALDNNLKGVKTVTVTSNANPKINYPVYKAIYNQDGTLKTFEISEQIGNALQVNYEYKEGVITKETIHYQNKEEMVNTFYYSDNKMYIHKPNQKTEIVWLEGDVLLKKVYSENILGTEDRLMHNCRITKSIGQDVNKVCFSDSNFKIPLVITDYVPEVDPKTLKINLNQGEKSEIKLIGERKYGITLQGNERFQIILDKEQRIISFNYLGNKALKEEPIQFKFTYTMY